MTTTDQATPVKTQQPQETQAIRRMFTGRRWRRIGEAITAYIFLLPAISIIGLFGIFPMLFSVFISLHRWRGNLGDYLGLTNYVRALDSLAYVAGMGVVLLFLSQVVKSIRNIIIDAQEHQDAPWLIALPALVTALGIGQFLRFAVFFLYEVLIIPQKIRGMERTRELFMQMLGEAWRHPQVNSTRWTSLLIILLGIALAYVFARYIVKGVRSLGYYARFVTTILFLTIGLAVGWLVWHDIQLAYAAAQESGESIQLWQHIIATIGGVLALVVMNELMKRIELPGKARTALIFGGLFLAGALKLVSEASGINMWVILIMVAGVALLFLSWKVWDAAQERESTLGLILWFGAALLMMIGAWVLLAELPAAIQSGYSTWWQGLQVTVYYSLFTVPLQLALALFMAILLFQNLKGKGLFRLIYFLPYITSPVASAAIFRVLFSGRPTAPVNNTLSLFGVQSLLWLDEPQGIFQMIVGQAVTLPNWLAGPSLALIVIVLFNIWTFFGYNAVVFLAGLGSIPQSLYDAAAIDGGGRWAQFRHITLPLLSPTTYFLSLIAIIGTFKAFTHVWVLRSGAALGTTDTASIVIFNEFNRNTRYGYASALALVLMGLVLILTVINNRIAEKKVFYG